MSAPRSPGDVIADSLIQQAFAANRALLDVVKKLQKVSSLIPRQSAAWRQVYHAVSTATKAMNQQAMKRPELFKFASESCYWPVIKSPGQGFQEAEISEEQVYKRLRVGEDTAFRVAGTRWKIDDEVGAYAYELWSMVDNGRLFKIDHDASPKDERAVEAFRKERHSLKGFTTSNWEKWWSLGEQVFDRDWENDDRRQKLSRLVTAPSKMKTPGKQRSWLIDALKDKFRSMSGANKA